MWRDIPIDRWKRTIWHLPGRGYAVQGPQTWSHEEGRYLPPEEIQYTTVADAIQALREWFGRSHELPPHLVQWRLTTASFWQDGNYQLQIWWDYELVATITVERDDDTYSISVDGESFTEGVPLEDVKQALYAAVEHVVEEYLSEILPNRGLDEDIASVVAERARRALRRGLRQEIEALPL